MTEPKQKPTKSQFQTMLVVVLICSIVTGYVAYDHFLEAQETYGAEQSFGYMAGGAASVMSIIFAIAAARAILVLSGVLKGVMEDAENA